MTLIIGRRGTNAHKTSPMHPITAVRIIAQIPTITITERIIPPITLEMSRSANARI
jgi:hypothetical protein